MARLAVTPAPSGRVSENRRDVARLLDFLPALYPGGAQWLDRRLAEVERGEAVCLSARRGTELVGVAIGKLKADGRYKLCTLYVAPEARRHGAGRMLLRGITNAANRASATEIYVTAAHTVSFQVWRLVRSEGFLPVVTQLNRYGAGRHETVFSLQLPCDAMPAKSELSPLTEH